MNAVGIEVAAYPASTLIEVVSVGSWIGDECDFFNALRFQPIEGSVQQLATDATSMIGRADKQRTDHRHVAQYWQAHASCHPSRRIRADPPASLVYLSDEQAPVQQMDLMWINTVLPDRKSYIVEISEIAFYHGPI
ncbi:hypothetical protein AQ610_18430 (plasmid) [Burkholderia humptydooensis]|nr:hypothetical protein AQ610_18430 [Burkholderia humptydooensis]